MSPWYRVFAAAENAIDPASLLEHLHDQGFTVPGHFRADEQGWFRAELVIDEEVTPVVLDRFLSSEEGIRAELNAWAAWLETIPDNLHHASLMEQIITTAQVYTLHHPLDDEDAFDNFEEVENLCLTCCRYIARQTNGIYQVDRRGFFTADGECLVTEE